MTMKIRTNVYQQEEVAGITIEFPYTYHYVDLKQTYTPWHWHEELEFTYVVSGRTKLLTSENSFMLHAGEAFFTNTNVLSRTENEESCIIESHIFNKVLLSGHYKSIFETEYMDPVLLNRNITALILTGKTESERKILRELKRLASIRGNKREAFRIRNILSEIWLFLLDLIQETDQQLRTVSVYNERIMQMMSYIQEHYAEKLTLEKIASAASLSKRECLRTFQNSIHESPFEYLLDYRVKMAQRLLTAAETAEVSITEIALQTGFSGSAYFGKIFKRVTGMTPGAYRRFHAGGEND